MVVLSEPETSSAMYWMKCTRADGGILSRLQHSYRLQTSLSRISCFSLPLLYFDSSSADFNLSSLSHAQPSSSSACGVAMCLSVTCLSHAAQAIQSGLGHTLREAWLCLMDSSLRNFPLAYSERHFCQEKVMSNANSLDLRAIRKILLCRHTHHQTALHLHELNAIQPSVFDPLAFVEYFLRCWSPKPSDKYFSIALFCPT